MLYTLTTNPAVDVNMETANVRPHTVNRTENLVCTPNGKGLNVSFALKHFGVLSGIIGFFGGFTGEYITEYCKENEYPLVSVDAEGITRVNFFVNVQRDEYKFVNKGPVISAEKQDLLLQKMEQIPDLKYLTVNGSEANGQTEDFYDRIFRNCEKKNVPVILDISSPKLKELLGYRPLLIKPNNEELKAIFGFDCETEEEAVLALRKLHAMGAQNILLTLGDQGSYFSNGKEVYYCTAKKVVLKSSACAGDAFLAGFLSLWLDDTRNVEAALIRAAAAGANTAESDGLGDFAKVAEYEKDICVNKMNLEG